MGVGSGSDDPTGSLHVWIFFSAGYHSQIFWVSFIGETPGTTWCVCVRFWTKIHKMPSSSPALASLPGTFIFVTCVKKSLKHSVWEISQTLTPLGLFWWEINRWCFLKLCFDFPDGILTKRSQLSESRHMNLSKLPQTSGGMHLVLDPAAVMFTCWCHWTMWFKSIPQYY